MNSRLLPLALIVVLSLRPFGARASDGFVESSTDVFCLVPTAVAAVKIMADKDEVGFREIVLSSALAVGVSYGLKAAITKPRPDGNGMHAMPSTHTMIAFSGATFLQRRYGWKWGVPAYALSTYVAWGRIYGGRHDVWDVLAGAAVGAGCALIFTRPFMKDKEVVVSPAVTDNAKGLSIAVRF